MFWLSLLFLAFCASTQAASVISAENEPSALIEGKVNAITGKWHPASLDLLIQGAEPIPIRRIFVGGNEGWALISSLAIEQATPHSQGHSYFVTENSGAKLRYKFTDQRKMFGEARYRKYKPVDLDQGYTNTSRGKISSQTNLHNQILWVGPDEKILKLCCPDGTVRTYQRMKGKYRLVSEELPHGNWILHSYQKKEGTALLQSIRTTNPSQTVTYAEAHFSYEKNRCKIVGSDLQAVEYRYNRDDLVQATSSERPEETFTYTALKQAPYFAHSIQSIAQPLGRKIETQYYTQKNAVVHGEQVIMNHRYYQTQDSGYFHDYIDLDPRAARVMTLLSPVDLDPTPQVTHSLLYDLPNRKTSVYDIEGQRTEYQWGDDFRLTQITRYNREGQKQNSDRFSWSPQGNLLSRSFLDPKGMPLWEKTYLYNELGDIVEEKTLGDFSGEGLSSYVRKFTYFSGEISHLQSIEEDSGKKVTYTYLPGSNLLTSASTYDRGDLKESKRWEYNGERILIREIVEDATVCLIREITPKPEAPYLGMPWIIEEKTDQTRLRKTVLHYTTGGRIAQKDCYDAAGVFCYSLFYKYDAQGRLIEQTDPIGRVEKMGYDACGNRIFHQKYSGRTQATFTYSFSNQLLTSHQVGDDGVTLHEEYQYDRKGRLLKEEKPLDHSVRYTYDSFGHLSQKIFPHHSFSYEWDFAGRLIAATDPEGHTTRTSYNPYGQPLQIIAPDGAVQTHRYAPNGDLKISIDPEGVTTSYVYDWKGRTEKQTVALGSTCLKEETTFYHLLQPICQVDAEGVETLFRYDRAGRLISREKAGKKIFYEYDPLGRLSLEREGDLLIRKHYDLADRVLEETRETPEGEILEKIQYRYDAADHKIAKIRCIEGKEAVEATLYDSIDRPIEKRNALGATTRIFYEATPLLKETTVDPLGLTTLRSYNADKKITLLQIRTAEGVLLDEQTFAYNFRGGLTHQSSTIFDPPRTVSVRFTYDCMGRLVEQTEGAASPHLKTTCHRYNRKGARVQTIKPDGVILDSTYDPLGQLHTLTSSDRTIDYLYTYDRLGRLLSSIDRSTGRKTERRYDPHGHILQETLATGHTFRSQYDLLGRRTELFFPDRSSLSFHYASLHLTRMERKNSSGHLLYQHSFDAYDQSGHLLKETPLLPQASITYGYDLSGRLIAHHSPHLVHEILQTDPVGNILHARLNGSASHYTYDALYQLTEEKGHTYQTDAHYCHLQKDKEHYTVNPLLQLEDLHPDPNGNPLEYPMDHQGARLFYDALDRLIKIARPDQEITYTYDAEHRRLTKVIRKQETREEWQFLYDGSQEIGSTDSSGNILELRLLKPSSSETHAAIALEIEGKIYLPLHDLYGNVLLLLSPHQKEPQETYHYNAFGQEPAPPSSNPWRYGCKRSDPETGLIYYGRRYYAPSLSRWLTPDPAGFTSSLNLYTFAQNNPLRYLDLFGLYHSDRASDTQFFDPHHPEMSAFYCASLGNTTQGTIDYHCGINNSKDDVKSAQACLHKTLDESYAVASHWVHNKNLLHGLSLVGSEKLEASRYLKYLSPVLAILAKLNLTHSYVGDVICYETSYLSQKADAILSLDTPQLKQLHTLFSNASYSFREALQNLSPQQRDTIIVISAGPTTLIEDRLAHRVYNIIGEKDYPSKACNGLFKSRIEREGVEVTWIPQSETKPGVFGHFFEQPDYQKAIREIIVEEIAGNYEIY